MSYIGVLQKKFVTPNLSKIKWRKQSSIRIEKRRSVKYMNTVSESHTHHLPSSSLPTYQVPNTSSPTRKLPTSSELPCIMSCCHFLYILSFPVADVCSVAVIKSSAKLRSNLFIFSFPSPSYLSLPNPFVSLVDFQTACRMLWRLHILAGMSYLKN